MSQPKLFYQSVFADHTPVASSTATGHVLNLIDFRAYTWWAPVSVPATITTDAGAGVSVDYCVVYGHDLFTNGCTLQVRASTDNFVGSDVLQATITPTNDEPFLLEFASASFRYWRVTITGTTPPNLAIVSLGSTLTVPAYMVPGFDPIGRRPKVTNNQSRGGHPLGKVIEYEAWAQSATFELLTWAWIRSAWLPAWEAHLRGSPFVFAWETDTYDDELRLVIIDGPFSTPHQAGGYINLTIRLEGVV